MAGHLSSGRCFRGSPAMMVSCLLSLLCILSVGGFVCTGPGGSPPADASDLPDVEPDITPDFGDIPDGHVVFVLSYQGGLVSPAQIYAQEFAVSGWRDDSGRPGAQTRHDWIQAPGGILAPTFIEPARAADCPCALCGLGCDPTIRGVVYEILAGQGVAFNWDGLVWDRQTCLDGTPCVVSRRAAAGRMIVEFCPSYSHVRCPEGYDCRVGDYQCRPVEFNYPEDQIVWYTHDCSSADQPGEFPSQCL